MHTQLPTGDSVKCNMISIENQHGLPDDFAGFDPRIAGAWHSDGPRQNPGL